MNFDGKSNRSWFQWKFSVYPNNAKAFGNLNAIFCFNYLDRKTHYAGPWNKDMLGLNSQQSTDTSKG